MRSDIGLMQPLVKQPNIEAGHGRTAGFVPVYEGKNAEFGFVDFFDMVNPLQHIPLVNLAYRKITGDTIKPISTVMGGALFGGPLGAAGGLVNVIIAEEAGRDMSNAFTSTHTSKPQDLSQSLLSYSQKAPSIDHNSNARYNA
jgi:hypothetical protein